MKLVLYKTFEVGSTGIFCKKTHYRHVPGIYPLPTRYPTPTINGKPPYFMKTHLYLNIL